MNCIVRQAGVLLLLLGGGCTAKDPGTDHPRIPETGTTGTATGTGTGTGSTTTPTFALQLIGLSIHFDNSQVDVARFDTVSGTATVLGPAPVDTAVMNDQEAALVADRGLYVVLDSGRVVSFDVATGAVVHDFDLGGSLRGVEYDPGTGELVGIWAPTIGADVTFASLDLDSQTLTPITPFPGAGSMNAQANAIDPDGRRYYVSIWYGADDDRLATIDLDTGDVLAEIPVGNPLYAGMSWDTATDRLLAFFWGGTSNGLAEINPENGHVSFVGHEFTSGNSGTVDPLTRRFYIDCGPSATDMAICWYDVDTGDYVDHLDVSGMEYGYQAL